MPNETIQNIEVSSWQEVIDKAVEHGYKGPTDSYNNRAKSWAFAYLRSRGIEMTVNPKKA